MGRGYDVKRNGNAPPSGNSNGVCKRAQQHRGDGSTYNLVDIAGLVERYAAIVYWLSQYLTGDSNEAEEVLQKTFLTARSGFPDFEPNESVVMRLAQIAVDESFAKLRTRDASKLLRLSLEAQANPVFVPQQVADWGNRPEERYDGEELRKILREGIQSLTPFSRIVFLLGDVAHLKSEQIADLFRVSVPRVRSHLQQGRLQLREHLNKYFKSNLKEKAQTA